MHRRRFLKSLGLGAIGAGLTSLYTWRIEPRWLECSFRDIPLRNLPKSLDGVRLAHLSDLHIGPRVSDSYLRDVFLRVQALAPDIVAYTGDFISYESGIIAKCKELFPQLPRGRLANIAVLGNHDYGRNWDEPELAAALQAELAMSGIQVLRNEAVSVNGLQLVGVDDLWADRCDPVRALADFDASGEGILLAHNPDIADLATLAPFCGWILSGHTHGGQCKPPFLDPPILPVRNKRYTAGAFRLSTTQQMYISRGVGHLLQVRFNVRPEVGIFTLRSA